jgi:hypothetical protein
VIPGFGGTGDLFDNIAYGYASQNPLNATDPTGMFNYYKNYDLGVSAHTPESMMRFLASNFGVMFPVPGHKSRLVEGDTMSLHDRGIGRQNPPAR